GQIVGNCVHVVGAVLPRTRVAGHTRLAAKHSFRSYFASNASYFGGECTELIHHDVDRVLQLEDLTLRLCGDLSVQITTGNRCRDVGDVSHLAGEVTRHEVHVVGQVLPRSCHAGHFGLSTKSAFSADFLGDAGYF